MYTRFGFSEIVENLGINNSSEVPTNPIIKAVRVVDIILDETTPLFNVTYGEWDSIGTIFYQELNQPSPTDSHFNENGISILPFARPFYSNIKQYPLINEIVHVVYLVDSNASGNTNSVVPYYLPPLNLWNSQVHNAIPSASPTPTTSNSDYESAEIGAYRRITPESPDIKLGTTFNEDNTIKNQPLFTFFSITLRIK